MKTLARIATRIVAAAVIVVLFFIVTQDFQIFPGIIPGLIYSPKDLALPRGVQSTFVTTDDGEKIEVWYLPAENEPLANRKTVAIFFHGNAQHVASTFGWQKWLQGMGISSYSFDYRGFGRSSGWPSEEGLYHDAEAVYRLFSSQHERENVDLIIAGNSIGTGMAAYLAAKTKPEILLLFASYTDLRSLIADLPLFGPLKYFSWYKLPTAAYINTLENTCIILVHGERDATIPVKHTHKLAESFSRPERLTKIIVSEAGHNDLLFRGKKTIEAALNNCLRNE